MHAHWEHDGEHHQARTPHDASLSTRIRQSSFRIHKLDRRIEQTIWSHLCRQLILNFLSSAYHNISEILQSYLPIMLLKTHHTVRSIIGTFMISLRPQRHQKRQLCRNSNKGCLQIVSLNPSSSRAILNQWTRKAQLGKLNRYLWQTTERQSKCRSPKAPQAKNFEVSTHSRGDFGRF